jgi:hypothetical protein
MKGIQPLSEQRVIHADTLNRPFYRYHSCKPRESGQGVLEIEDILRATLDPRGMETPYSIDPQHGGAFVLRRIRCMSNCLFDPLDMVEDTSECRHL